ncbi:zinc-binding metallopeptidase family protein [Flavilitoribacter nigricans]|uniref:Uncharacterized protein n=1 Tax=Flavilitoribacter nigricans (strain ATCC 23147 / DSM 23189 / NBRC 102662 / NCIMB 1420 / SS-2) TaxID=1122177 RepID=A0A2D0NEV0_FLAN2|nr:hypothetical protein [Flavilitoribacter nigricans]PHN06313.1 hypothetical protein CRP01_12125 [Flavilitoribacter nigricans DSM 23189 = NBRC 102662]
MLRFRHKNTKLDLVIHFDDATGLPLFKERQKILDLIRTYLSLPYTVAEYGCGKKCSIILNKLMELGIPPYALKRGMIMEKDMSDRALRQKDYTKRPHALIIENPLYHPKDFYKEILFQMLEDKLPEVKVRESQIQVGPYLLHHHKELQFIQARSHIFSVITFWQEKKNEAVELVLDPTINPEALIEMEELRDLLHDEEALIFTAPILGKFRLDQRYLTFWHRQQLYDSDLARSMKRLAKKRHDAFIRLINGAGEGSIGDPDTWTYANNIASGTGAYARKQKKLTGKGDVLNNWLSKLINARQSQRGEVLMVRDKLNALVKKLELREVIREDARRAEAALAPLAQVELIIAYYRASRQLFNWWRQGLPMQEIFRKPLQLEKVAGISMRLRRRIEKLAEVSETTEQKIDARALNDRFVKASLETIKQMNDAGLSVFIDKVGNIHGLLLPTGNNEKFRTLNGNGTSLKRFASSCICHCSHIDTVFDAGKYDGRLGVLAGIEAAHVFADLQHYFKFKLKARRNSRSLMVTAFIGEEMTFTGRGISMPGSSAVAGSTTPAEVHKMKNSAGEIFRDKLVGMLQTFREAQSDGRIELMNDFSEATDGTSLLQSCYDPQKFFSPHTYERHIEQGPILDRQRVPLVLVDTIMGIHQEDFLFQGLMSEQGALAFNRQLRKISQQDKYRNLRVTVGIMKGDPKERTAKELDFGMRLRMRGELNHAGATLMEDRRDPGVAIARLAENFVERFNEDQNNKFDKLKPVIGEIELQPGTNRNVIPGSALLTLGVNGPAAISEMEHLSLQVQSWIVDTLLDSVAFGGEGVVLEAVDPINFISLANRVDLSIDIRYAEDKIKTEFLLEARMALEKICTAMELQVAREVEQELRPYPLAQSGQILQIERSYGGSHNPDEAQLDRDLLIGSLLQLEVSRDFMESRQKTPVNLFTNVRKLIPKVWKDRLESFVSGALHDTCNIAAKMSKN